MTKNRDYTAHGPVGPTMFWKQSNDTKSSESAGADDETDDEDMDEQDEDDVEEEQDADGGTEDGEEAGMSELVEELIEEIIETEGEGHAWEATIG